MPAINAFYRLRKIEGIEKKPATRELLNWIRALQADPDFRHEALADGALPYLGSSVQEKQRPGEGRSGQPLLRSLKSYRR